MKLFITGVAGFLGSHVANRMIELGYEVIGVDNMVGGFIENVNPNVKFYEADCLDNKKMVELTKDVDIVFHAACTAHDGFSLFSPYYITQNTFEITMSVLSAAASNNVKKFIYCSSMARYGNQPKLPYTEDMECMPVTPYGVGKYASELVIKQICELNNINYTILVPHNIIGPAHNYIDPFRNVAGIMINRMLQGKQPIIYGDGEQKRTFSFIGDCISCIEKTIIQDNLNGEIINIGPDEEFVTVNELARTIAKYINFDLHPIYVPDRPNEIRMATCSSDKARRLLGYQTKTSFEDGIYEMIEYVKKHGTKQFRYNYEIEINNEHTPETWKNKMF